ncbi:MAG: GtrA family protein [Sphingomonadaceae bacterium]
MSEPSPALSPAEAQAPRSLRQRLFSLRAALMLWRNTVSSTLAFGVGLGVLWLLVEKAGWNEYPATATSFVTANTLHYLLGRLWIFAGSARRVGSGYLYFFANAAMGLAITIALFALFYDVAGMNYMLARIVGSVFAGLAMFASNALFNFKSL